MPAKKQPFHFEKALNDLEKLVGEMETGQLSLESSLAHFEQGIGLVRTCQTQLQHATQKVQQLVEKNGELELSAVNISTDSTDETDSD